jgi:dTDP-4-dehydrorhamnose 3,5-epimerase
MSRFDVIPTPLNGLLLIQRKKIEDNRGFLSRFYCSEELAQVGLRQPIVQINHTLTCKKGTVRGMHFQYPPYTEIKFISCLHGEIWDIAVDLRSSSPTFLHWYGATLSAENCKSLLIPQGFAHGFQTLTENCELMYLHTAPYQSAAEGGLNVCDPRLNISWPLPITELSERDRNRSFIDQNFSGIML